MLSLLLFILIYDTIKKRNKISFIIINYCSLAEANFISSFYVLFLDFFLLPSVPRRNNQAIYRCQKLIHSFIKYPIIESFKINHTENIIQQKN